ncbi:MAG: acyltransferase [Eubacteriales bacterium]
MLAQDDLIHYIRKETGVMEAGKINITDEQFAEYVRLTSCSDNFNDNTKRAQALGLGGRNILVAPGVIIRVPLCQIGSDVFIGLYTYLNGNVTVGDHTLIGPHCSVTAGNHKFDPATGYFSARTEKDGDESIVIGYGCWLASNVTVTAGVKMGRANLVCAGAVVTKDTPDHAIMAGIPAKQVGRIDPITGEYIWFQNGMVL